MKVWRNFEKLENILNEFDEYLKIIDKHIGNDSLKNLYTLFEKIKQIISSFIKLKKFHMK
jgi:hypothetical protein